MNLLRLRVLGVVLAGLVVAGLVLDRLIAPVWAEARARQPALRLESSLTAAGQGVTLALLGGFRALIADATWIRMFVAWEKRDLAGTQTLVQLVTAIDPRPAYFWINGARILAHDLSTWRFEAAGGDAAGPAVEQRIDREQGAVALQHLDAALAFHPVSPDLWIERASIQIIRLRDPAAAAESYRRAWELPRAPYYAARLHAEMLRRAGRAAEAWQWLVRLLPALPADDPGAGRDVVLARIRELERELGIPPERVYREAPGGGR
jgi:hypothetical protein